MRFDLRDAVDAVRDIAANAVEKTSDIVEYAGDILRGDVAGGAEGILHSSLDIATHAAEKAKEVFTGSYAHEEE